MRRPSRARRTRALLSALIVSVFAVFCGGEIASAQQEPSAPQPVSAVQLQSAIAKLGDLDYSARTNASRLVRRTPAAQAVPALIQAVSEHGDGYVRYRALVLLTGFNDPRAKDSMRESLTSPNDRLLDIEFMPLKQRSPQTAAAVARNALGSVKVSAGVCGVRRLPGRPI